MSDWFKGIKGINQDLLNISNTALKDNQKSYKTKRAKDLGIDLEEADVTEKVEEKAEKLSEAGEGDKEKFKKLFDAMLKKFGVDSPEDLSTEKKKEFFNAIDKAFKSDDEEDGIEEGVLPAISTRTSSPVQGSPRRFTIASDFMKYITSKMVVSQYDLVFSDQEGNIIKPNEFLKKTSKKKSKTWIFQKDKPWFSVSYQSGKYQLDVAPRKDGGPAVKLADAMMSQLGTDFMENN